MSTDEQNSTKTTETHQDNLLEPQPLSKIIFPTLYNSTYRDLTNTLKKYLNAFNFLNLRRTCKAGFEIYGPKEKTRLTMLEYSASVSCLDLFIFGIGNGYEHTLSVEEQAIKNGDLDFLEWLLRNFTHGNDNHNYLRYSYAVKYDKIECLKLIVKVDRQKGKEHIPEWVCYEAAVYGSYDCLKYCFEWAKKCGGIVSQKNAFICAKYGHLKCLQLCEEFLGPLFTNDVCQKTIETGQYDCFVYLVTKYEGFVSLYIVNSVIQYGQLKFLKFIIDSGYQLDDRQCTVAVENGQIECFKLLLSNGCKMSHWTCYEAIKTHNFECFKLAIDNGYQVNQQLLVEVALVEDQCYIEHIKEKRPDILNDRCATKSFCETAFFNNKWKNLDYAIKNKFGGYEKFIRPDIMYNIDNANMMETIKLKKRKVEVVEVVEE